MEFVSRQFGGHSLAEVLALLRTQGTYVLSGFGLVLCADLGDNTFEVLESTGEADEDRESLGTYRLDAANLRHAIRQGIEKLYGDGKVLGLQIENEDGETYASESHEVLSPEIAWTELDDVSQLPEYDWMINVILPGEIEDCTVID